ncbi:MULTISPECIES: hypothetical protein [Legionella]|uniref:Transglutaminase-like domain-containing protein n=1 Tax=Legionella steelei TaxID=947033 RepID=A0A0W0ZJX2_9GAMM|nr:MULTISPECIES: hypothetical protein [Legionella]KTD69214.1 hypothetical protein Lste_2372 [Legionella steelei]MBN9229127.1 hypothetical protein [Legionella steelei]OJW17020.1 MAG: hypothetical protein BGO44_13795 [Legionella sp. 39-23]
MVKLFDNKKAGIDPLKYRNTLRKALETTMSVCIASTSALVMNQLTAKIRAERMAQYNENSLIAVQGVGEIRTFLFKVTKHLEDKKMSFLDARAPIKYTMSRCKAGNCEHQAFYLAASLRQQKIPAWIYDIEDIGHTVVITKDFLLDPWIGDIFPLAGTNFDKFYNSSLNMCASWLNQLLADKQFVFHERLNKETLVQHFVEQNEEKSIKVGCCALF